MQTGSRRRACWLLIALATTGILRAQDKALAPSPIVDANTRFAFSLFQQLTTQTPDHNILVAPTGLSLTFSLLDNGSDPETRKEIESAFEFAGMDIVGINAGFAALRKEMNLIPLPPQKKAAHADAPAPWIDNPNRLVIADSLWIKHGYFGKEFLDMSRDYYGVDLKKWLPSPSASAQIGLWASKRIQKPMSVDIGTMAQDGFLLVDVTRFHSFWVHKFDEKLTKPAPFTLLGGQKKTVPMMYEGAEFRYFEGPRFQAAVLPYSENASMYIFLPAEDSSLKELEQTLTAKSWQEWLGQFAFRLGMVGLPKFEAKTSFDVRGALETLGVKRIFEQFSALRPAVTVPEGARLTKALQKTQISVDEEGTEAISVSFAAGVPGGIPGGTIGERPKPFVMIVNRPFFFAIRHTGTGQLLFLGAVVEP
ncbi:MAG TPA: serpin family protein [Terriglobales bacterium]|nr:serpin family protein [Terriglobales bacterium]